MTSGHRPTTPRLRSSSGGGPRSTKPKIGPCPGPGVTLGRRAWSSVAPPNIYGWRIVCEENHPTPPPSNLRPRTVNAVFMGITCAVLLFLSLLTGPDGLKPPLLGSNQLNPTLPPPSSAQLAWHAPSPTISFHTYLTGLCKLFSTLFLSSLLPHSL